MDATQIAAIGAAAAGVLSLLLGPILLKIKVNAVDRLLARKDYRGAHLMLAVLGVAVSLHPTSTGEPGDAGAPDASDELPATDEIAQPPAITAADTTGPIKRGILASPEDPPTGPIRLPKA